MPDERGRITCADFGQILGISGRIGGGVKAACGRVETMSVQQNLYLVISKNFWRLPDLYEIITVHILLTQFSL